MKKNNQKIAAVMLAIGLLAAACGSSVEDLAGDATDGTADIIEAINAGDVVAVEDDAGAMEDDADAMEDDADAMEDEEVAMEDDADASDIPATVVDIAASSPDFSILVTALEEAQLLDTLEADGPFTVFAPTNDAFEALLATGNITEEQLLGVSDLGEILTTHVVPGEILAEDAIAADGTSIESVSGAMIDIDVVDGVVVINGTAMVIAADLTAGNGVVHVIDGILTP